MAAAKAATSHAIPAPTHSRAARWLPRPAMASKPTQIAIQALATHSAVSASEDAGSATAWGSRESGTEAMVAVAGMRNAATPVAGVADSRRIVVHPRTAVRPRPECRMREEAMRLRDSPNSIRPRRDTAPAPIGGRHPVHRRRAVPSVSPSPTPTTITSGRGRSAVNTVRLAGRLVLSLGLVALAACSSGAAPNRDEGVQVQVPSTLTMVGCGPKTSRSSPIGRATIEGFAERRARELPNVGGLRVEDPRRREVGPRHARRRRRPRVARIGVTSFDALNAPLLIDSFDTQDQKVLQSPLMGELAAGLEKDGLVAVGVLPGPMRLLLGAVAPNRKAGRFRGPAHRLQPVVSGGGADLCQSRGHRCAVRVRGPWSSSTGFDRYRTAGRIDRGQRVRGGGSITHRKRRAVAAPDRRVYAQGRVREAFARRAGGAARRHRWCAIPSPCRSTRASSRPQTALSGCAVPVSRLPSMRARTMSPALPGGRPARVRRAGTGAR